MEYVEDMIWNDRVDQKCKERVKIRTNDKTSGNICLSPMLHTASVIMHSA